MKNILYSALALGTLLGLAACSNDSPEPTPIGEGATFTIQLPTDMQTRATFGDQSQVTLNNLQWTIYEVDANGNHNMITSGQKVAFGSSQTQETVTLDLLKGRTYQVVFYADNSTNPYITYTDGTIAVDYTKGASNDAQEDAFIGKSAEITVDGAFNETVTLTRPYAQLNWGTNDLDKATVSSLLSTLTATVRVSSGLYQNYSIIDGTYSNEVTGDVAFPAVEFSKLPAETFPVDGYSLIAMNYLLTGQGTLDCQLIFNNDLPAVDVNAAPVNANYRTNIYGQLLTSPGNFNILINHDWNTPDFNDNATPANENEFVADLTNPVISTINVTKDMDLTSFTADQLTFDTPKTINMSNGTTLKIDGGAPLTANNGLTINGGTLTNQGLMSRASGPGYPCDLILIKGGELNIDNATLINDTTYHYHGSAATGLNTSAISYWGDSKVNITNSTIRSGMYALCGMGASNTSVLNLKNSTFTSTSSSQDGTNNWAYCMRLYGSTGTLDNCLVRGIQGGVSTGNGIQLLITSGKYVTVNTPGKEDAFYAIYATGGGTVTITGGEFASPNYRFANSVTEGPCCVLCGDNDTGQPIGYVVLQGGKYSSKAYNNITKQIYTPASPYAYQALTNDAPYLWQVVKN